VQERRNHGNWEVFPILQKWGNMGYKKNLNSYRETFILALLSNNIGA